MFLLCRGPQVKVLVASTPCAFNPVHYDRWYAWIAHAHIDLKQLMPCLSARIPNLIGVIRNSFEWLCRMQHYHLRNSSSDEARAGWNHAGIRKGLAVKGST